MAERKFLVDLNLNQNQLLNGVVHNVTATRPSTADGKWTGDGLPSNPKDGQLVYASNEHELLTYKATGNETTAGWYSAGTNYVLPVATSDVLGGIKIGYSPAAYTEGTSTNKQFALLLGSNTSDNPANARGYVAIDVASNTTPGIIRIATDAEVTTGTATNLAINPKQLNDLKTAIGNPMHFVGAAQGNTTAGTAGTAFNPSTKTLGDTYKVIANSTTPTYVELTVQTGSGTTANAKVGDTIICSDATNNYWTIIPSGDEPVGTVTSVAVGEGLTTDVNNGDPITSSGTISLLAATSSALGGIKIGYIDNANNHAVQLNNATDHVGEAYVTVGNGTFQIAANGGTAVNTLFNADSSSAATGINFINSAIETGETAMIQAVVAAASGSTPATVQFNHKTSGVTAITTDSLVKVSVDRFGHITSTTAPALTDIQAAIGTVEPNKVFAGPSTGTAGTDDAQPTFRSLVAADIPALGNINNQGQLTNTAAAPAANDQIVVADGTTGAIKRTNLTIGSNHAIAFKEVYTNSALTASSGVCTWEITHGLGTDDVNVTVKDASTGEEVYCEVLSTSSTSGSTTTYKVTIKMNSGDIAADTYKAILIG